MISYNVSLTVDTDIEMEWIEWMKLHHIPRVIATGCFVAYDFYKLIKPEEEEGETFILQYKAMDMSQYDKYVEEFAYDLQQESLLKFPEKFVAFRTLMVEV